MLKKYSDSNEFKWLLWLNTKNKHIKNSIKGDIFECRNLMPSIIIFLVCAVANGSHVENMDNKEKGGNQRIWVP